MADLSHSKLSHCKLATVVSCFLRCAQREYWALMEELRTRHQQFCAAGGSALSSPGLSEQLLHRSSGNMVCNWMCRKVQHHRKHSKVGSITSTCRSHISHNSHGRLGRGAQRSRPLPAVGAGSRAQAELLWQQGRWTSRCSSAKESCAAAQARPRGGQQPSSGGRGSSRRRCSSWCAGQVA